MQSPSLPTPITIKPALGSKHPQSFSKMHSLRILDSIYSYGITSSFLKPSQSLVPGHADINPPQFYRYLQIDANVDFYLKVNRKRMQRVSKYFGENTHNQNGVQIIEQLKNMQYCETIIGFCYLDSLSDRELSQLSRVQVRGKTVRNEQKIRELISFYTIQVSNFVELEDIFIIIEQLQLESLKQTIEELLSSKLAATSSNQQEEYRELLFPILQLAYQYQCRKIFDCCMRVLQEEQFEQINYNRFDLIKYLNFRLFQIVLCKHQQLKISGQILGICSENIREVILLYSDRYGYNQETCDKLMTKYVSDLKQHERNSLFYNLGAQTNTNFMKRDPLIENGVVDPIIYDSVSTPRTNKKVVRKYSETLDFKRQDSRKMGAFVKVDKKPIQTRVIDDVQERDHKVINRPNKNVARQRPVGLEIDAMQATPDKAPESPRKYYLGSLQSDSAVPQEYLSDDAIQQPMSPFTIRNSYLRNKILQSQNLYFSNRNANEDNQSQDPYAMMNKISSLLNQYNAECDIRDSSVMSVQHKFDESEIMLNSEDNGQQRTDSKKSERKREKGERGKGGEGGEEGEREEGQLKQKKEQIYSQELSKSKRQSDSRGWRESEEKDSSNY